MPKLLADAVAVSELPDRSRVRWTIEEARKVVAAFEASGLSMEKFAAREGLKVERLSRWKRKLTAEEKTRRVARRPPAEPTLAATPKFVELRPSARSQGRPSQVEIVLRTGHVLFVGDTFEPTSLRRILELLERDAEC